MNGNDYIEIEEAHAHNIFKDWINETFTFDDIPEDYKIKWIDSFLEGD